MAATAEGVIAYIDSLDVDSGYVYPLEEALTEPSEHRQDPGKRERERMVIAAALERPWSRALDFGCGVGANFDLFATSSGRADGSALAAIDLDPARVAIAQTRRPDPEALASAVSVGSVEAIKRAPADMRFDIILACQVIGHVPRAAADDIVTTLFSRLAPGGRLLLAVPAAFPEARAMAFARRWDGDDLYHIVRPELDPESSAFRTLVDAEAFDAEARRPRSGRLPVRAFAVGPGSPTPLRALPAGLANPGDTLSALVREPHHMDTEIYSIHAYIEDTPAIADVLVTLGAASDRGAKR